MRPAPAQRPERRSSRFAGRVPPIPRRIIIHNRQPAHAVDRGWLRRLAGEFFDQFPDRQNIELDINLVDATEMTRLNETYLRHAGSTDVITFDYRDPADPASRLHGEIFICVDEAVRQAHRFRTRWQVELVRYLVHGGLHLLGYDDRRAAARRRMKVAENRWVRELTRHFPAGMVPRKLAKSRSSS